MWRYILAGILCVLLAAYFGCQSQPGTPEFPEGSEIGDGSRRGTLAPGDCVGSKTCSTKACITDWFDNYCTGSALTVYGDEFAFTSQIDLDNGEFDIIGHANFDGCTLICSSGGSDPAFKTMQSSPHDYSEIKNIVFDLCPSVHTDTAMLFYGARPKFSGTDIMASKCCYILFQFIDDDFQIDDMYIENICTLVVDFGYPDGSKVTDSDLEGVFQINAAAGGGNVMEFRRNDIYDLRTFGSGTNTVKLADNEFPSTSEVAVYLHGSFTANADSNETHRGKCKCDAEGDFDVGGSATLNLNSWKYNGTIYGIPEISNVQSSRNGNTVTVMWTTSFGGTSKVIWGYSCNALDSTATSPGSSMIHSVQFDVPESEGCIYFEAISSISGCSADADTSDCGIEAENITFSNYQTFFNPFLCTMMVNWTTNVKSSSEVYYGGSCAGLYNYATGAGNTTSHSVVCDCTGISGSVFAYKVRSSNSCDTSESSCRTARKGKCMGQ